jgi:hypothetical protein
VAEFPPCARPGCGHTAWCHGAQSGHPTASDPCHAAAARGGPMIDECPCTGYVRAAGAQEPSAARGVSPVTPPPAGSSPQDGPEGPQSATARLRLAADEVERRAAAATHGPWQPEYGCLNRARVQAVFVECAGGEDGCDGVDCIDGTHGIGGFDKSADNEWAILANPALAGPLAALLRAEAAHAGLLAALDEEAPGTVRLRLSTTAEVLALADVILGSAR